MTAQHFRNNHDCVILLVVYSDMKASLKHLTHFFPLFAQYSCPVFLKWLQTILFLMTLKQKLYSFNWTIVTCRKGTISTQQNHIFYLDFWPCTQNSFTCSAALCWKLKFLYSRIPSSSQNDFDLFYSILGCVLPLQERALCQISAICSVLCCPCPSYSLMPHNVISPITFWCSIWLYALYLPFCASKWSIHVFDLLSPSLPTLAPLSTEPMCTVSFPKNETGHIWSDTVHTTGPYSFYAVNDMMMTLPQTINCASHQLQR